MEDVLKVKEVAKILQVSPFTIYKLLKHGTLKGFKLTAKVKEEHSQWRIRREALMEYMRRGQDEANPDN